MLHVGFGYLIAIIIAIILSCFVVQVVYMYTCTQSSTIIILYLILAIACPSSPKSLCMNLIYTHCIVALLYI